jgi:hypothetical protein
MSDETKEWREAGTELAHASSRLVRALDAVDAARPAYAAFRSDEK